MLYAPLALLIANRLREGADRDAPVRRGAR
jgi:hypothetical protein